MNLTELKALAQDLRNERTEFQRKADYAQACLNELQRKMAIMKLEAQMDTPLADTFGGWCPSSPATIFTSHKRPMAFAIYVTETVVSACIGSLSPKPHSL